MSRRSVKYFTAVPSKRTHQVFGLRHKFLQLVRPVKVSADAHSRLSVL